jgi:branched-chain amino acid aminotransferase
MMNVFFVIDNVAVTPSLEEGTILEGVTRDSVMKGLTEMGIKVEERRISIDEVVSAYKAGKVNEVFGTGTAAVIAPIRELNYNGFAMTFDPTKYKISSAVKEWLNGIREGTLADDHGWMLSV